MSSDLPKLYLARHSDTAWTDSHQHTGRTDLPLNERGEQYARQSHRLVAPGPNRDGAGRRSHAGQVRGPGVGLGRGAVDD